MVSVKSHHGRVLALNECVHSHHLRPVVATDCVSGVKIHLSPEARFLSNRSGRADLSAAAHTHSDAPSGQVVQIQTTVGVRRVVLPEKHAHCITATRQYTFSDRKHFLRTSTRICPATTIALVEKHKTKQKA